ncbi:hypothetical protein TrRE_jg2334 [Triparma retinervis]|uniref:Uncharacterized protein n=1 Tax=Triparma retinervis TaxID=2557542 RepID=A0A9W6ZIG7_9STRA|nr:hypothetical protein TrRE_jg2334 [Triparma retinervis]
MAPIAPSQKMKIAPTSTGLDLEMDNLLKRMVVDSEIFLDNLVSSCKVVNDIDALKARLPELGLNLAPFNRMVIDAALGRRQEELDAERVKKTKTRARIETKRVAVGLQGKEEVLEGLVGANKNYREEYEQRQIGVDADNWQDWSVTIFEALQYTTSAMLKMLFLVALFSVFAWVNVVAVAKVAGADNSELLDDTNSTGSEGLMTQKNAGQPDNSGLGLFVFGFACISISIGYSMVQIFLVMRTMQSYIVLFIPYTLIMLSVYLYYEFGAWYISGTVLGALFNLGAGISAAVVTYSKLTDRNDLNGTTLGIAAKRAMNEMGLVENSDQMNRAKKVKLALITALPTIFMFSVFMLLAVGIFYLYQLYDGTGWKIGVTGLALAIKIAGNKGLILLLGNLAMWLTDIHLYEYEITTALIVRMLQLSLPDENTAMLIGLAGAVIEVGTRIFFYVMFMKKGLSNPLMSSEEKKAYAKRGKLRVQDASNDMVVEYVSSIIASMFLIYLAPTGKFAFATTTEISTAAVLKLCAYQIVPELFLDFYVTFMEIYGGLKEMHISYWKASTGADMESKFWALRRGDLFKANLFKAFSTWFVVSFVLCLCLK